MDSAVLPCLFPTALGMDDTESPYENMQPVPVGQDGGGAQPSPGEGSAGAQGSWGGPGAGSEWCFGVLPLASLKRKCPHHAACATTLTLCCLQTGGLGAARGSPSHQVMPVAGCVLQRAGPAGGVSVWGCWQPSWCCWWSLWSWGLAVSCGGWEVLRLEVAGQHREGGQSWAGVGAVAERGGRTEVWYLTLLVARSLCPVCHKLACIPGM